MEIALSVVAMVVWWFGVGPFLMFFNAVAHSETNLLIGYAKKDGKSTLKLRMYQVLHCAGYIIWVIVLIGIPTIVKHFVN